MPLDPQVKPLLDALAASGGPAMEELPPEEGRVLMRGLTAMEELVDVHRIEDRTIPGPAGEIPVRIYTPTEAEGADRGVLVWFHGGGWVVGDLVTADPTARLLANGSGCVVVSVDYRLSPEHPAPAGQDDAVAATRWVAEHAEELGADGRRVAVGGDSAGGNLAAVVSQRLRDEGGPAVAFQLLVYPAVDLTLSSESIVTNGEGYLLTRSGMEWFTAHHLGDLDGKDPRVSPIYADSLADLPPALVITAEFDPLRDEGEAYAAALRDAGNTVASTRYDGMIHGFFGMATLVTAGRTAVDQASAALREVLA